MSMLYFNFNELSWIPWIVTLLATISSLFGLVLFSIHRRNNQQKMNDLEEKMHEHDLAIYSKTEEQLQKFKKGLMQHLSEISERIAGNEAHTNKLTNQIDALRSAILEDYSNDQAQFNNAAENDKKETEKL
ncbi:MAG: hypothetical protein Q7V19_00390 [Bacteroidales bacterium]|nr:hypothetical protein [Bacteroidales bacterium]